MQINWKLRFKNKVTLTAIVLCGIALIYKVLGLFGIVPAIAENELVTVAGMAIDLLVLLGVIVDPTTDGMDDSAQVMNYRRPRMDG